MQKFTISESAIIAIIEGLSAEYGLGGYKSRPLIEGQYWNSTLLIGNGGLDLNDDQKKICIGYFRKFFDLEMSEITPYLKATTIGEWSGLISQSLLSRMMQFHFHPAGPRSEETICTHAVSNLYQDGAAAASLLQGRRRLVSMVSPHSLLGFVLSVITPALQGIEVFDGRFMSPEELNGTLAFGDVIVATPSIWSYMMREDILAPDNSMGVSFGEVMKPELAASMRRNGIGVLRELYGSTQNGLIAWRDSPNDGFVLFDHWKKNEDNLARTEPDGSAKEFAPMDHFNWDNQRCFSLAGRRDGAIQIGAVNVFPDKIAKLICDHNFVSKCTIRVANSSGIAQSNRLIADITLKKEALTSEDIARDIDGWCKANLGLHERPHIFNFYK